MNAPVGYIAGCKNSLAIFAGSILMAGLCLGIPFFINEFYETGAAKFSTAALLSLPIRYRKFSFKKKIAIFFTIVLLALVILFIAFQKSKARNAVAVRWVEHTQEVLFTTQEIYSLATEMQSGSRGYVIAGNENYLRLFHNAEKSIDSSVSHLQLLIKDNPVQQRRADTLKLLIDNYIISRKALINARRDGGFEAAQVIFLKGDGKLMFGELRAVITVIKEEENQLLVKRKEESRQKNQNLSRISFSLQAIIVLLLLGALLMIHNNSRARDKAEVNLRESEEKLSMVFNSIDEGFCIIEMIFDEQKKPVDYRFLVINPSFEKQTGLRDAVGKRMREFAPNHEEHWFEIYGRIALTGESLRFENRAEQLGRWYDVYAFRFGDPKNMQVAILFNDITARKQVQDTIQEMNLELEKRVDEKTKEVIEKERQYRFLLQNMREGIQVIGHDWRYLFVNDSVVGQSKYSNDELLGHTMMEKYPGIENTELFGVLQRCMKERKPELFENEFTFPNGTKEWYELSIQPVPDGLFILSMDITERKEAEESTVKERDLSDSIINSLPGLFFLVDESQTLLRWNKNLETISGFSAAEMGKLGPLDFFDTGEKQLLGEKISEVFIKGMADVEAYLFTKSKEKIPYYLYGWRVIFEDKPCLIGVGIDITERKKGEEKIKKYAAELQASNTELERFAYVASHDLQEPLRMVSSFLNLLEEEFSGKLNETAKEYIHFAVDGAGRMKKLVNDLLQYSRVGNNKENFSDVNLNEIMDYAIRVLDEDIKKSNAILEVKTLPVISANKTLIGQLFINLLGNALKYHGDKRPEIEVGYTENPGSYIFYVKDNGIGIDPKFFDKIFIIFQRLHNKNEYSGTGIGLAICKKIVETHKGKIWVESAEGQGSTFYFSILKNII